MPSLLGRVTVFKTFGSLEYEGNLVLTDIFQEQSTPVEWYLLTDLAELLKKSSPFSRLTLRCQKRLSQFPPPTHPSVGVYKYVLFIYVFYSRLYWSITITLLTYEVMLEMMVNLDKTPQS